jgi:RNA-dependent RNA polymerase
MFNSDENLSADMIREWMGVFDGIKTVAKYAGIVLIHMDLTVSARLGQCFSTTRPIVDVDVIEIPDIEYNGYCFSDGVCSRTAFLTDQVGKMSESLAELVTSAIGYDPVNPRKKWAG